jgi:hypothetical protein
MDILGDLFGLLISRRLRKSSSSAARFKLTFSRQSCNGQDLYVLQLGLLIT